MNPDEVFDSRTTWEAFMAPVPDSPHGRREFDWDRLVELILEHDPQEVEVGLARDWSPTAGTVYRDRQPVTDGYVYLTSNWAEPVASLDGVPHPCWRPDTGQPPSLVWPPSALARLAAGRIDPAAATMRAEILHDWFIDRNMPTEAAAVHTI